MEVVRSWWSYVRSGGSYASQSDLALTFGLGSASRAEMVRVHWPGGPVETWRGLPVDAGHTLSQGSGAGS